MSKTPCKVEAFITATAYGSKLSINGVEIPNLVSFRVEARIKEATKVYVEFYAPEGVKIDGEVAEVVPQSKVEMP